MNDLISEIAENLWKTAYDCGRKDAERLLGKVPWIPTASGAGKMCGACGWTKHPADKRNYKYCPNCGARMGEKDDDTD